MTPAQPDAVFAALADPTRRALLRALAAEGPASAGHLARRFPVSRQAVSKHLASLAEAGLVTAERLGRERRYRLQPAPLAEVADWLAEVHGFWDARLARLADSLAAEDPPRTGSPALGHRAAAGPRRARDTRGP